MNKISLYVLLILLYLGISKSFSPSEKKTTFIQNKNVYSSIFEGAPISVILEKSLSTGALIKTYHHHYRVIHAFKVPTKIYVRVSKDLFEMNKSNIGMSLFRRFETGKESSVALPPGSIYIGSPSYGTWKTDRSGEKNWAFHRTYKNFPKIFHWDKFIPTYRFYRTMNIKEKANESFYGLNNEFGTNGITTKQYYKLIKRDLKEPRLKDILRKYSNIPMWEKIDE